MTLGRLVVVVLSLPLVASCHPGWELRTIFTGTRSWEMLCVQDALKHAPDVENPRLIQDESGQEVQFLTTNGVKGGFFFSNESPNVLVGYLSGFGTAPPAQRYGELEMRLRSLESRIHPVCGMSNGEGELSCVTHGLLQPRFCPDTSSMAK